MHAACHGNRVPPPDYIREVIQLPIEHGADVNTVSSQDGTVLTALAKVSSLESFNVIRYLISQGADCNKAGSSLFIPLIAAASSSGQKSVQVMHLLKAAGANVNAFGGVHGTALVAALSAASFCGTEKYSRLLDWGADGTITGPSGTFTNVAARRSEPTTQDRTFDSDQHLSPKQLDEALLLACTTGGAATITNLLNRGADVNFEADLLGSIGTSLIAVLRITSSYHLAKVQILLIHGANVNIPTMGYQDVLQMYLDYKQPYIPVVEHLLTSNVDINAPTGVHGNGTASEIAVRRYWEADGNTQRSWEKIIIFLHQKGALFHDSDFELLLQYPWFLGLLDTLPTNTMQIG